MPHARMDSKSAGHGGEGPLKSQQTPFARYARNAANDDDDRTNKPSTESTTNDNNTYQMTTKPHVVLDKQCMIETPNNQTVDG